MEEIPKKPIVKYPDGKTGVFDNGSDIYHGLDGEIIDYDNLILTNYLKQEARSWQAVYRKGWSRLQKINRKKRKYVSNEKCPRKTVEKLPDDTICQRFVEIPYASAYHQPGGDND